MRARWMLVFFAILALAPNLAGCLRVGPGEDLHLVCEEKTGSPRKAYGIEELLARTEVNGSLDGAARIRILEAARQHVITQSGAPHAAFEAELSQTTPSAWRFVAVGVWDEGPPDLYDVLVEDVDGQARAPDLVDAPRRIRDEAWSDANASGEDLPTLARATWDPELPGCVTLHTPERDVVVHTAQGRIVARVTP